MISEVGSQSTAYWDQCRYNDDNDDDNNDDDDSSSCDSDVDDESDRIHIWQDLMSEVLVKILALEFIIVKETQGICIKTIRNDS